MRWRPSKNRAGSTLHQTKKSCQLRKVRIMRKLTRQSKLKWDRLYLSLWLAIITIWVCSPHLENNVRHLEWANGEVHTSRSLTMNMRMVTWLQRHQSGWPRVLSTQDLNPQSMTEDSPTMHQCMTRCSGLSTLISAEAPQQWALITSVKTNSLTYSQ